MATTQLNDRLDLVAVREYGAGAGVPLADARRVLLWANPLALGVVRTLDAGVEYDVPATIQLVVYRPTSNSTMAQLRADLEA